MSDVSISVTGPFSKVSGASITYAVNSIPVAMLSLDPVEAKNFLCNPDQKRRSPVTVSMKSSRGCLKFDGLLDGVSVTQSEGGMSYQAVVKSNFQDLAEVFPKCPGLSPLGVDPFKRQWQLKCDDQSGPLVFKYVNWLGKCGVGVSVVTFFKAAITAMLANQSSGTLTQIYGKATNLGMIGDFLMNNAGYKKKLAKAVKLADSIDISAVSDCPISSELPGVSQAVLTAMANGGDAFAWDLLTSMFNSLGLCLIAGNSKLFVAPYHGLVLKQAAPPGFQQSAKDKVNVAYPADYASFSLADNGYVDIDYCAPFIAGTVIDAMNTSTPSVKVSISDIDSSLAASGGVYLANVPDWLAPSIMHSSFIGNAMRPDVAKGKSLVSAFVTPDKFKSSWDKSVGFGAHPAQEKFDKQSVLLTNWAQIQLLTKKLSDRTGNIQSNFSPRWCPGTSGSLYTRLPGVFLRFFVDSVTHSIGVSAPGSGYATTTVNFSYGRLGDRLKVDEDKVFGYNSGKMDALQNSFVSDISY